MRSLGGEHLARALGSAIAVVGLSLASHVLAGGSSPGPGSLALLTGLAALATTPLTRSGVRLPGMLLVLAAAQAALHLLFESHTGHGHHGGSPLVMAAMHAAATALTALVLSRGEVALRRAWAWCAPRRLPRPAGPRPPARRPLPVPVHRTAAPPSPGTDAVMGRAPPLGSPAP